MGHMSVCKAIDVDEELRQKVELLEQELASLKQQAFGNSNQKPPMEKPSNTAQVKPSAAEDTTKANKDQSRADELYAQAQIFLNQKHLSKAKVVLQELCKNYPDAPQFMLSSYWLGEIGLEGRDYTNASISYGEAYSAYKQKLADKEAISDEVHYRAIESLAKLAYCLKHLKKNQDACVTLKQFEKESSGLPRNIQTFALQVSEQLKCQKKPT